MKAPFFIAAMAAVSVAFTGCAPVPPNNPAAPAAPDGATPLQDRVEALLDENPGWTGLAIVIDGPGADRTTAAAGTAAPDGTAFTSNTPLRLASVTKTYVAATALRLWEQGRLDLDAPLSSLLDQRYTDMLRADGYEIDALTPRHLLMHAAGLPDHADERYLGMVLENPARIWTREEQVALAMEDREPLAGPNERFSYSDTGYVLIGHIIEKITGQSLAEAVRTQLGFADLGLQATWWEETETPPDGAPARAHQYLGGADTTGWHGSLDLYGGGGLIAGTQDMAIFFAALMRGKVFDQPETLQEMLTAPGQPAPERYRLGVFYDVQDGVSYYSHGGFWGTLVLYAPDADIAIAGSVLDQEGYYRMRALMLDILSEYTP